jgi:hypothetical protein
MRRTLTDSQIANLLDALKLARQDVFHHVPDPIASAHLKIIDAAIASAEGK